MDDKLKKEAFEFVFAEFGKSIWWLPLALTKEGNPDGNPPDLNLAQAESVFAELVERELLLPAINEKGQHCWLIHQGKKKEWQALINPPNWFQRNWKKGMYGLVALILWLSSIFISTYLSKSVEKRVDQIDAKISEWTVGDERANEKKPKPKEEHGD